MSRDSEGRRYSDEEFALILRKASEISESGDARPDGLSLPEIQQIAREAGIDPAAVARAAASLPEHGHDRLAAFVGGPTKYRLEQTLPEKVTEEALSRILQAIKKAAHHQGRTEHILDSVEWRNVVEDGGSQIFVSVSARDEGTTIEVMGDRSTPAALTFIIPTVAAVVGSGVIGAAVEPSTALGIAGIFGGMIGSAFVVSRTIWTHTSTSFRRKLGAIMDAASRTAEAASTESRSGSTAPSGGNDESGSGVD